MLVPGLALKIILELLALKITIPDPPADDPPPAELPLPPPPPPVLAVPAVEAVAGDCLPPLPPPPTPPFAVCV